MADDSCAKNRRKSKPKTLDELRVLLSYDPLTGEFRRLTTRGPKHKAGQIAGGVTEHGYINITIDGVRYYGHRLAWLFMTGEWPADQIDHVDLNRTNNRFANLREASNSDNLCNRGPTKRNKTGCRGVHFTRDRIGKPWFVAVRKGKRLYVKRFKTKDEAVAMRHAAARNIHGEFARTADSRGGAGT